MGLFSSSSKTSAAQTTNTQNAASNSAPTIAGPGTMGKNASFKPVVLSDVLAPTVVMGNIGRESTATTNIISTDYGAVEGGINLAGYALDVAALASGNAALSAASAVSGLAGGHNAALNAVSGVVNEALNFGGEVVGKAAALLSGNNAAALSVVGDTVSDSLYFARSANSAAYDFAADSRDKAAALTLSIVDGYAADTRAALNDALDLTRSESKSARDFAIAATSSESARLSETGLKIAGALALGLLVVSAWVMKK